MSDLERELEQELHRVLDAVSAQPIPPRRAGHAGFGWRAAIGGAGTALTIKVLTGVAVAAAAVTVAGAVTTGSLNPAVWGQQVSDRVVKCKQQVANSGQHGIGDCVSPFSSQHGVTVSSAARHHGNGDGNGNPNGNASSSRNGSGSANGPGKDRGKDHSPSSKTSSTAPPTLDSEPTDPVNTHTPGTISPQP